MARGKVLLFLDGDTLLAPRVIERIVETWMKFGGNPNDSSSLMIPSVDIDPLKTGYDYESVMRETLSKAGMKMGPEREEAARAQEKREAGQSALTAAAVRPYGGERVGLGSWIVKDVKHMENTDVRWNETRSRCWAVSGEDMQRVNNWDSDFVGYGEEDIELAYRLYQTCLTRFRILHLPDILAAHITHGIDYRRRDREWARNGALLIIKHPELQKERCAFFRKMGLENLLMREIGKMEGVFACDDGHGTRARHAGQVMTPFERMVCTTAGAELHIGKPHVSSS